MIAVHSEHNQYRKLETSIAAKYFFHVVRNVLMHRNTYNVYKKYLAFVAQFFFIRYYICSLQSVVIYIIGEIATFYYFTYHTILLSELYHQVIIERRHSRMQINHVLWTFLERSLFDTITIYFQLFFLILIRRRSG